MNDDVAPTALDGAKPLELWLEERFEQIYAARFRVENVLFSGRSDFQRVDLVATAGHGRMLLNDGLVMVSERDEFVYHEMIAHVPLFVHPRPRRVLVIGGGDAGTVREVLRHTEVEHVRLVEIDALVVEACRAHFAWTAAALDDPRVELTIGDGVAFVRETSEHFDVVLIDSTDPIGPAAPLFGADFYRDVRRILAEPGIVVAQAETPWYQARAQRALLETLRRRFRRIQLYNYSNLTYPGGLWSFAFASDDLHPVVDLDPTRLQRAGLACRYYNAAVHGAAFSLPEFVLQAVGDLIDRP